MADVSTFAFRDLVTSGDRSRFLFVDSSALINFDKIGKLDTLLDANRIVVITPEVRQEAAVDGLTSTNPGAPESASRIGLWIQSQEALGHAQVIAFDPDRPRYTGAGAGDQSIRDDIRYLGGAGQAIVVSDDNHLATKPLEGSDQPVLTGNYYLNGLLVGGGITPLNYFETTEAGTKAGFNQKVMPNDSDPIIKDNVEYELLINDVVRGTYRYTAVGSSKIVRDSDFIELAPYEKGGFRDGDLIKVTDASDGGHIDTLFDTANLQPWFTNAFAYNPQDHLRGQDTLNDDNTYTKTVFDTGSEPWSSQSSTFDAYQRLQSQRVVFDDGSQRNKNFDNANNRIWDERDITTNSTGNVTNVQVKLNGESQARSSANDGDFSAIGQVFGSAIGRAIVGKMPIRSCR
jgi:hypothetical protein